MKKVIVGMMACLLAIGITPGNAFGSADAHNVRLYLSDTEYMVENTAQKIYDYADLLSDEEEATLQEMATDMSERFHADFVIATIDDNPAPGTSKIDSTLDFADLFFDENYFGTQAGGTGYNEGNGTCFVVDMENRGLALSTTGFTRSKFQDKEIDTIIDDASNYLSDGDYYDACKYSLEFVDGVMTYGGLNEMISHEFKEMTVGGKIKTSFEGINFLIPLILAAVLCVFVMVFLLIRHRTTKKATEAGVYTVPDSFVVHRQNEIFVNTFTTVQTISDDNNSSGGGGSHTSSGGGSHGGGSGKF